MTTTTVALVATASKPDLQAQLRATWRKSGEHYAEQLKRFIRLTIIAAVPSLTNVIAGGHFDWKTLLAFILPFAEVAWRQMFPAMGAASADSAPGVTIVPSQVGGGEDVPAEPEDPTAPPVTTDGVPLTIDQLTPDDGAEPQPIGDAEDPDDTGDAAP